jgi:hypothetical protein
MDAVDRQKIKAKDVDPQKKSRAGRKNQELKCLDNLS